METNHARALVHAEEAERVLLRLYDLISPADCQGFTPGLAIQVAAVHAHLATFWQSEPDVADRALVA